MTLQSGMKWDHKSVDDDLLKLSVFLTKNNTNGRVKKEYTVDHIQLMLGPGGKVFMIVSESTGIIYGAIGISINDITCYEKQNTVVSCVFLCVHEKLREKNMCSVLYAHVKSLYDNKMFYFTSNKINNPLCYVQKFMRPLNYSKLYDCKYMCIKNNLEKTANYFNVIHDKESNIRKYIDADCDSLYTIYKENCDKFTVFMNYSIDTFKNILNNPTIKTYVAIDDNGDVVDFICYCLINHYNGSDRFVDANILIYTNTKMTAYEMIYNSMPYINDYADIISTYNIGYNNEFIGANVNYTENTQNFAYDMKFLIDSDVLLYGCESGFNLVKLTNQEICWMLL